MNQDPWLDSFDRFAQDQKLKIIDGEPMVKESCLNLFLLLGAPKISDVNN